MSSESSCWVTVQLRVCVWGGGGLMSVPAVCVYTNKFYFYAVLRSIHHIVECGYNKLIPPEVKCCLRLCSNISHRGFIFFQTLLSFYTLNKWKTNQQFYIIIISICFLHVCICTQCYILLIVSFRVFVPVVSCVSQGSVAGDAFTLSLVEGVQGVRVVTRLPASSAEVTSLIKTLQHVLPLCIRNLSSNQSALIN